MSDTPPPLPPVIPAAAVPPPLPQPPAAQSLLRSPLTADNSILPPPLPPPIVAGAMPRQVGPDTLAVISLTCGIAGYVMTAAACLCPAVSPLIWLAGLICGIVSKDHGGIRVAGIICSAVGLGLSASLLLLAFIFGQFT